MKRIPSLNGLKDSSDTLKKKFTEEPVLMMPNQLKPFQIEANASKFATGAVLTQMDSNGDYHPVAFISRTLSSIEKTMRSIIENSLVSSELWRNGNTISKDQDLQPKFCPITKILPTLGKLRNSTDNKPVGLCIFQNMASSSHI